MRLYHVIDKYIKYLKFFDVKVPDNKNQKRPYVGIVVEVGGVTYYAPLSSPKPKHLKMKNGKDFRKINKGVYGAINFNNMIPVPVAELLLIDFDAIQDKQYRRLLQHQYEYIKEDEANIIKIARALRNLFFVGGDTLKSIDKKVMQRCCCFPLLEQACRQYRQNDSDNM